MKIAVVGATGLVGSKMLQVLAERNFPMDELIPVASEKSVGKSLNWKGRSWQITDMQSAIHMKPDIALFSAGGTTSLEWAGAFAEQGTYVIDNSSAWRMDPTKKLVVPEINGHVLTPEDRIIANPNCSTIQLVMVLKPLHDAYRVERVVVSTYQSVTGTGKKAVDQLMNERSGKEGEMAYPYVIDMNLIPQIDVFQENGYTKEEMKMVLETMKIMDDDTIRVSPTCVRVPVMGGHSESCNIEFAKTPDVQAVRALLTSFPGITVVDETEKKEYPMPLVHAHDSDQVFVGRIRMDISKPNSLHCWIVSDNLRKGAATNAVQIAELLVRMGYVTAQQ
ncbi:MAG: aspartate-semialdehyde dehydrogenase [Flavobacteriales bacterium]